MQKLDTSIVLAVLCASVFQAVWNFYAKKSSSDKMTLLALGWLAFGLVATPLTFFTTHTAEIQVTDWLWVLLSGFVHTFYLFVLGWGYNIGHVSVVFPIARGLGVALTAFVFAFFSLEEISPLGTMALGAVVFGAFLIGSKEVFSKKTASSLIAALFIGFAICLYSSIDSIGVKNIPPLFFLALMNLLSGIFALPILYSVKREALYMTFKKHKLEACLISLAGSASYIIILWAYTTSPAPYIVALREVSIVITTLLGALVLKEPLYKRKIGGVVFILLGVLSIKSL